MVHVKQIKERLKPPGAQHQSDLTHFFWNPKSLSCLKQLVNLKKICGWKFRWVKTFFPHMCSFLQHIDVYWCPQATSIANGRFKMIRCHSFPWFSESNQLVNTIIWYLDPLFFMAEAPVCAASARFLQLRFSGCGFVSHLETKIESSWFLPHFKSRIGLESLPW